MTPSNPPNGAPVEHQWQQVLESGPSCVPLERLGETLTAPERAHVAACARCQTELEMMVSFEANAPVEGDGLSVEWIAARARRQVAAAQSAAAVPARPLVRPQWGLPSWALMAASVALVAGGAALMVRPGSGPAPTANEDTYRALRVEAVAPVGDVAEAPADLSWTAVPGALQYEVRLTEVDGTELWRVTTSAPAVSIPPDIRSRVLPAKTLTWQVTARDDQGRSLAESGATRFRVQMAPAGTTR